MSSQSACTIPFGGLCAPTPTIKDFKYCCQELTAPNRSPGHGLRDFVPLGQPMLLTRTPRRAMRRGAGIEKCMGEYTFPAQLFNVVWSK